MRSPPLTESVSLQAAKAWLSDAAYGSWETAWSRVEPAYRRILAHRAAVAQGLAPGETEELVEGAAEEWHDRGLWAEFAEDQCLSFLEAVACLDRRAWVVRPLPVALDCELVLLVDASGPSEAWEVADSTPRRVIEVESLVDTDCPPRRLLTSAILFYMRRDDYADWLIAGFNEEPPDWPTSS